MFVDFDALDLGELEALADSLPGPHSWVWGTDDIFVCRVCHMAFCWGEAIPEGRCDPDPEILARPRMG
jgi:hypothetical protein